MLLVIDVGNTNITLGVFNGENLSATFRMTTKIQRTSDEYGIALNELIWHQGFEKSDIDACIVASVVPDIMHSLGSAMIKYFGIKPIVVSAGIKTGLKIKTENPKQVGADRIVDISMAYHTYHKSCIIVDFGTATTFDYISGEGVFKYTVIAPGLGIVANALTSQTAKLPEIEIQKPESILNGNTITGMQAGVIYGYIGSVEYIIKQMKKELKLKDCLVIATGGLGKVIAKETKEIDLFDPDVAYKGMRILYDLNKK